MADEPVIPEQDDFDKAFAEAVAESTNTPPATPPADPPADPPATPPATPPVDPPADPPATPPADPPVAETPEAKTAREAAEAQAAKDTQATEDAKTVREAAEAIKTAQAAKDAEAARKQEEKDKAETPAQKKIREEFEATMAPYEFTAEEKSALEKMKADFPGEYAVMEARLKQTDREINARVYKAVQGVLQQVYKDITPVAQQSQELSLQQHRAMLHSAHADFDKVVDLIPDWIKKQPAYLQPAMQAVYDGGDAQSVIALVSDFKKATGTGTTVDTSAADAAKAAAQAAKDAAAAKAAKDAADLVPVGTKRTTVGPKGKADPNDFDGAFAEAAALL